MRCGGAFVFALLAVALSQNVTLNSTTENSTVDLEVFAVFETSGEDVSLNLTNVMNEATGALEEDEVATTSTKTTEASTMKSTSSATESETPPTEISEDSTSSRTSTESSTQSAPQSTSIGAGKKPHSPGERTIPEGSENILLMNVNQLNSLAKCPSGEVCSGAPTQVISMTGIVLLIGWLIE